MLTDMDPLSRRQYPLFFRQRAASRNIVRQICGSQSCPPRANATG